ncbi:hypothetical protein FA13DRAFT_1778000 [Coprinellus micaceus]|uniref:Uncharacterized protein n=1 Tax=Coprinellus micaceus TaxID=71717 RepID=A0A4Y7SQN0_COPMI|nr:hypothetical protein FA13DRAFT_1778000 [Coprinellus micaceus]
MHPKSITLISSLVACCLALPINRELSSKGLDICGETEPDRRSILTGSVEQRDEYSNELPPEREYLFKMVPFGHQKHKGGKPGGTPLLSGPQLLPVNGPNKFAHINLQLGPKA